MKKIYITLFILLSIALILPVSAQIGTRFPSERKVVRDPVTGVELVFLTSSQSGDRKIYPTHNQWTSDGEWIIFSSGRVAGEAMAVNENTGDIVQVTEGGYSGMLSVARKSMKLYFMRRPEGPRGAPVAVEVVEIDLEKLFADSESGNLKPATAYERICGITPAEMGAGGDMALDGGEEWVWFV